MALFTFIPPVRPTSFLLIRVMNITEHLLLSHNTSEHHAPRKEHSMSIFNQIGGGSGNKIEVGLLQNYSNTHFAIPTEFSSIDEIESVFVAVEYRTTYNVSSLNSSVLRAYSYTIGETHAYYMYGSAANLTTNLPYIENGYLKIKAPSGVNSTWVSDQIKHHITIIGK